MVQFTKKIQKQGDVKNIFIFFGEWERVRVFVVVSLGLVWRKTRQPPPEHRKNVSARTPQKSYYL